MKKLILLAITLLNSVGNIKSVLIAERAAVKAIAPILPLIAKIDVAHRYEESFTQQGRQNIIGKKTSYLPALIPAALFKSRQQKGLAHSEKLQEALLQAVKNKQFTFEYVKDEEKKNSEFKTYLTNFFEENPDLAMEWAKNQEKYRKINRNSDISLPAANKHWRLGWVDWILDKGAAEVDWRIQSATRQYLSQLASPLYEGNEAFFETQDIGEMSAAKRFALSTAYQEGQGLISDKIGVVSNYLNCLIPALFLNFMQKDTISPAKKLAGLHFMKLNIDKGFVGNRSSRMGYLNSVFPGLGKMVFLKKCAKDAWGNAIGLKFNSFMPNKLSRIINMATYPDPIPAREEVVEHYVGSGVKLEPHSLRGDKIVMSISLRNLIPAALFKAAQENKSPTIATAFKRNAHNAWVKATNLIPKYPTTTCYNYFGWQDIYMPFVKRFLGLDLTLHEHIEKRKKEVIKNLSRNEPECLKSIPCAALYVEDLMANKHKASPNFIIGNSLRSTKNYETNEIVSDSFVKIRTFNKWYPFVSQTLGFFFRKVMLDA